MASTILLVGFVGLIQAVTIGSELLDSARKQTVARQLVEHEFDQLRLRAWSTISGLSSSGTLTINQAGTATTGNEDRFAITNYTTTTTDDNVALLAFAAGFTLSYVRTNPRTDFYQFTFTIRWTGNTGRAYSRSYTTYLTNNGLHLSYQKT